jgi:hypothetical protein
MCPSIPVSWADKACLRCLVLVSQDDTQRRRCSAGLHSRAVQGRVLAGLAALTLGLLLSGAPGSAETSRADASAKVCGEKEMYGKAFELRVKQGLNSCAKVRRITDGRCRVRLHERWSCFSFRTPHPFLAWFPSKELFARRWSKLIVAHRYPCAEAAVTPEEWIGETGKFPTRQQMLADDLIRCGLLDGMDVEQVEGLLGSADHSGTDRNGRPYRDYVVGPERDSFFQIDPELLSIRFSSQGIFRAASFYQG